MSSEKSQKIKEKIKSEMSNNSDIFTFLSGDNLSLFLEKIHTEDLMSFESPEFFLRNLAKVLQEDGGDSRSNRTSWFKFYGESMEDSSLMTELVKPSELINWWKIESYFNTLVDVLSVDKEEEVKPFFFFKQMDMRRFIVKNKGRSDLGEAAERQYSRRSEMSDVLRAVILEGASFESKVKIEGEMVPLLSVASAIIDGHAELGAALSERAALKYVKTNLPPAYEYLNNIFDLESFCCGEVDEKIFSVRQKITPISSAISNETPTEDIVSKKQ